MRLTVRTLLAWLDNVLPPHDQKQLGEKVTASAAAQQLVERIRRVVERPGIPAPRVDGKGLASDANSVAEYLDNSLESDRLEAFERICIESDMHLAEVAACHNILAGMAHDPAVGAPLDPASRARLLAALQHHLEVAGAEQSVEAGKADVAHRHSESQSLSESHTLPHLQPRHVRSQPQRASRGAWAAALTAIALLAVLGVFLIRAIVGKGSREVALPGKVKPVAVAEPDAKLAPVPEAAAPEPAAEEAPAAPSAVTEPAPAEAPLSTKIEETPAPPPPPVAAPPAMEKPAATPAPVENSGDTGLGVSAPRVPQGDALAIAAPMPAAPGAAAETFPASAVAPPVATAVAPAPGAAQPALGFVGGDGLLLHKVSEAGHSAWLPFAPGAAVGAREDVIVPPGFHPEVNVRGVTIRIFPATRAVLSVDPDGTPRIEVVFGKTVARASRPDARLAVAAGGLVGTITRGLGEPVAIAVELERVPGSDPVAEPARQRASLTAVAGGIVWRQAQADEQGGGRPLDGIAGEGMLETRAALVWDSARPSVASFDRPSALPAWIESTPQVDKLSRGAGEALKAKVAAVAPLDTALRELATDKRVENRIVAAETLALLGEFDDVAELLCADAPGRRLEGRQWAALEAATVPLALARGANAAAKLRKAFEDHGPHGKAEQLFAMALGFSDEALAGGAARALVDALEDADLVVRRYAFKCLCDVVQPSASDRLRYRPDGLPELRREGVNWWRGQLEKGLIRRAAPVPKAA